jgi:hypothetical protein
MAADIAIKGSMSVPWRMLEWRTGIQDTLLQFIIT